MAQNPIVEAGEALPGSETDLVIYDNGEYFVEIGLPVKSPTLGMVYRIVNKRYLIVEDEKHYEYQARIVADTLKVENEKLRTAEYEASLVPKNRFH